AHDLVEDDRVRGIDPRRFASEVREMMLDPVVDTELRRELARGGFVRGGDLDARRACRAGAQELDLKVADASADLQDRRAADPSCDQQISDRARFTRQTFPAGPARVGRGSTPSEDAPEAGGNAACGHQANGSSAED